MDSYSLALEHDLWMLRKLPGNQAIRRFSSRQQALHESLALVQPLGAVLVLTPVHSGKAGR